LNEHENEIDLLEIFQLIWSKKRFISIFTGIVTIIAIIYSLLATPYYKSHITIYPMGEDAGNSSLGQLQGLASTFGINMGSANSTPFYIPDIVNSRRLKKQIINNKWETEVFDNPVNLITYWEIDDTTGFSIKKIITGLFKSNEQSDPYYKYQEKAIEQLSEQLSVSIDDESGLITISLLMEEPQLSADIVNFVAEKVKHYISKEVFIQSSENRQFIENRMAEAKEELSNSEVKLTDFRKEHPLALDTPDLQLQRGRFMRDIEVNQEVFITLRQQYELAKIEELKEAPIINILDEGEAAVEKTKPRRTLIVIISTILGITLSLTFVFINFIFNKQNIA
jgi:uncharacterized protein involved in exopolysaccharide biosynthesis